MNQAQPLDIVTVAIAIGGLIFGPEIAAMLGPYAVIFLGALVGGVWSASRRPQSSRTSTLGYLALIVLMAVLFTAPLAGAVAHYLGSQDARPYFAPVAAVIAGIGPDWPAVVRWALSLVRTIAERRVAAAPPADQPPGDRP